MAYLPVELPTGDYYGGNRPGNNLFSETLVAVDLKTGVRKWHYQFVHHGIWDFDMAARADPRRHHRQRPRDQGDRAADEAGVALRVRSHQRPAGLADRRAAGAERRRARRVVRADAAVRHQTAGLRSAGRLGRRSDRLHAGAARRSGEARLAIQDGSDLHAAGGEQGRGSAGDVACCRPPAAAPTGPAAAYDPETHIVYVFSQTHADIARPGPGAAKATTSAGSRATRRRWRLRRRAGRPRLEQRGAGRGGRARAGRRASGSGRRRPRRRQRRRPARAAAAAAV